MGEALSVLWTYIVVAVDTVLKKQAQEIKTLTTTQGELVRHEVGLFKENLEI